MALQSKIGRLAAVKYSGFYGKQLLQLKANHKPFNAILDKMLEAHAFRNAIKLVNDELKFKYAKQASGFSQIGLEMARARQGRKDVCSIFKAAVIAASKISNQDGECTAIDSMNLGFEITPLEERRETIIQRVRDRMLTASIEYKCDLYKTLKQLEEKYYRASELEQIEDQTKENAFITPDS